MASVVLTSVSYLNFPATKRGYRSYLKALGYDNWDGVNKPNQFVMGLSEFKTRGETIEEKEERLEKINDRLLYCITELGQDHNDPSTNAYHLSGNARNIVRELEAFYGIGA